MTACDIGVWLVSLKSCDCRCDHASVVMGNKMYVTAGSGSENLWYNDLYTLDLDTNTWVEHHPKTDSAPTPRDYTGATAASARVSSEGHG